MTECSLAGEYLSDIPQFSKPKKFVPGHYLFLKTHSFPRAMLSEQITYCFSKQMNYVHVQISEHIFTPKWRLLFILPLWRKLSSHYMVFREVFLTKVRLSNKIKNKSQVNPGTNEKWN